MEKMRYQFIGLFIMIVVFAGCDKTERATKKFFKEGRWTVTSLTAGTTSFTKLPKWQVFPCTEYMDTCDANWEHPNGSSNNFYWEFYNLGGNFDLITKTEFVDTTTMAFAQCKNFSGEYKVIDKRMNGFTFESEETFGYPGKLVTIVIEKD